MRRRILSTPLTTAAGGMVALAVMVFLVTALFGLFNPRDTSQPEGAVVAAALRVAGGQSLYLDLLKGPYVTAMYGPFLYLLLGGLVRSLGAGVAGAYLVGRALSLLSALACAALVGHLAGRYGASRPARWMAAGLFLASPLILPVAYSCRSDLLALALALGGMALFERWADSAVCYLAAVPLLAAIYTKQTAVSALLAILLYLLLRRRPARAFGMALAVIVPAAAILLFLDRTTGGLATLNLLQVPGASPLSLVGRPAGALLNFLSLAALPLILAMPVLSGPPRAERGLLLPACYAGAALSVSLGASAKLGSDAYYFIEPLAATLVLSAAGLTALLAEGRTLAERPALLGFGAFLILLLGSMGMTARIGEYRYASNAAVIRLAAAAPGDVLIEDENVALKCGKPVTMMDPFAFAYMQRRGLWDARPLNRRILDRQFGAIILRSPIEHPSHFQGEAYWPEETLSAIGRAYAPEGTVDGYVVYRPRPQAGAVAREEGRS
jgi:hypothetical protein